MYGSRSVIEGTNLDANVRQAVNHFEFNDALVSKKGLWQSLRAYCESTGVPVTTVVPRTFYLSGGAIQSLTSPSSRKATPGNSSCSTEVKNGESNGNGVQGNDDRAEFIAFCAEMDGESGASSFSSLLGGLSGSPETVAASPVEPELTTASTTVAARQPRSQTSPAVEKGEVKLAAVEKHTHDACSPESDEPLACGPSRDPSPPARGAVPQSRKPVAESNFPSKGVAESCLPDTVQRSASPPPPPLPPSSSPCGRCPPGCSPDTLTEESPLPKLREDSVPNNGSVSLGIDTPLPAERDRGTKKSGHSCRGEGARERQGALGGPALGGGPEGGAQRKGAAANESSTQPNKTGNQINDEIDSGMASAEATRNPTTGGIGNAPEKTERSRLTPVDMKPTWVVKPAANTNCGFGIQVCCSLQEVLDVVDAKDNRAGRSGWVVQRYIERPLLVRGRKFDIRLFVLLVADPSTRSWRRKFKSSAQHKLNHGISNSNEKHHNRVSGGNGQPMKGVSAGKGVELLPVGEEQEKAAPADGSSSAGGRIQPPPSPLRAWCHQDAYVRTSSVRYSNDPSKVKNKFVHLTNNAVQRRSPSYGQDEPGNKLTLADLQEWLDGDQSGHKGKARGWVEQTLRPRMHSLAATSVAAAATAGINKRGRPYAFELLGYDFMVDDDLRVWLIEVNSNPCLEFVCPLLQGMIVRVIDDTLSIALDSVAGERAYLSRNVIALDESTLVIHKDTAVNNFTERFKLDQEQIHHSGSDGGIRRTSASLGVGGRLDGYVIATTTSAPPPSNRHSETIEARQLLDGGHAHIQHEALDAVISGHLQWEELRYPASVGERFWDS
eukprot:g8631.t1